MTTTVDALRSWLKVAKEKGATHMLVAVDMYDMYDYPVYVMPGQDPHEVAAKEQEIMECYALHLDVEEQLRERMAFHFDGPSDVDSVGREEAPRSALRDGPVATTTLSCEGCRHNVSESYIVQGDSGYAVHCTHGGEKRYIGDTTWVTPDWCPVLGQPVSANVSLEAAIRTEMAKRGLVLDSMRRATKSSVVFAFSSRPGEFWALTSEVKVAGGWTAIDLDNALFRECVVQLDAWSTRDDS